MYLPLLLSLYHVTLLRVPFFCFFSAMWEYTLWLLSIECFCCLLLNAGAGVIPVKLYVPFVSENQWRANFKRISFHSIFHLKKKIIPFMFAHHERGFSGGRAGRQNRVCAFNKHQEPFFL